MPDRFLDALKTLLGDRYRLERELGGGGMSRVFLATELGLKRDVVVKVLPPELLSAESLRRFEREIETTVALQHPHILPVLTAGGSGDILFYITPFVRGQSLRRRLSEGPPLAFEESVSLARELLSAVAFAHARGIVHRDIKPSNVLVAEGHAVLADFGIARALVSADDGAPPSLTHDGASAYSAPEGSSHPTSDLYAVAAVLHTMLVGEAPAPGALAADIAQSLRLRHPEVPLPRVERVSRGIAAALAAASARPASATDLAALLAGSAERRRWRLAAPFTVVAAALFALILFLQSSQQSSDVGSGGAAPPSSLARASAPPAMPRGFSSANVTPSVVVSAPLSAIDSAWRMAERGDARQALRLAREADRSGRTNARGQLLHAMLATFDESPDLPTEEPRVAVSRSLAGRSALSKHEAALAEAWQALAAGKYGEATPLFRALTDVGDVRVWALLGLAEAIARDNVVLPSATSPSGYAFRADWEEGVRALAGALRETPTADRDHVFSRLQRLLFIEETRLRPGRGADGTAFTGRAIAVGDTIQFIPYRAGPQSPMPSRGPDNRRALELMRAELARLVEQWRRESPERAAPWALTAALLEARGNVRVAGEDRFSALDAMARARRLAVDDASRAHWTRDYARLLLRAGDFAAVARLAREALVGAAASDLDTQDFLLPIAVVTGRSRLGTVLLRQTSGLRTRQVAGPDGTPVRLGPELSRARAEFIVSAALGVCDDAVRGAPARLMALADAQFPRETRPPWFEFALLQEPLEHAQACTGLAPLARTSGPLRPINRAASQMLAGDTGAVRAWLAGTDRARTQPGVTSPTPEVAVGEALLRVAIGDSTGALSVLRNSLEALPTHPTRVFIREGAMASIGRAMLLSAEWSIGRDSTAARHWIDRVDALWTAADAPMRAEVARVRRLLEGSSPR